MSYFEFATLADIADRVRLQPGRLVVVQFGELLVPVDRDALLALWGDCDDPADEIQVRIGVDAIYIESSE
jgi:hypothetical protein